MFKTVSHSCIVQATKGKSVNGIRNFYSGREWDREWPMCKGLFLVIESNEILLQLLPELESPTMYLHIQFWTL